MQKGELREWLKTINAWVRDLEGALAFEEKWSSAEQLTAFTEDAKLEISICSSTHPRLGDVASKLIRIRHLWVKMAH